MVVSYSLLVQVNSIVATEIAFMKYVESVKTFSVWIEWFQQLGKDENRKKEIVSYHNCFKSRQTWMLDNSMKSSENSCIN